MKTLYSIFLMSLCTFPVSLLFGQEEGSVAPKNGQTAPSYLTDPKSLLIPRPQFFQKNKNNVLRPLQKAQEPPVSSGASDGVPSASEEPPAFPLSGLDEQSPYTEEEVSPTYPLPLLPRLEERTSPLEAPLSPERPETQLLFVPEDAAQDSVPFRRPEMAPQIEPGQFHEFPSFQSPPPPPPRIPPEQELQRAPRQFMFPPPRPATQADDVDLYAIEPEHPGPGMGKVLFEEEEQEAATIERQEDVATRGDINFNNVSIIEYIRFLSKISGKNFIFDEANLQFNISVVSEEPTTVKNLMAALLQELQVRGLSLIEQGNTILIHPNPNVRGPGTLLLDRNSPEQGDIVTAVFRLNALDPNKAANIIRPLLSTSALVNVLEDTNTLLITDIGINVSKIGALLKSLDAPQSGVEVGQFVAVQSVAASLMTTAEQILQAVAQGNPFQLISHTPTNSIFVIGNPFLVERALALLRHLDSQQRTTSILDLELGLHEGAGGQQRGGFRQGGGILPGQQVAETDRERAIRRQLLEQGYQLGPSGELIPPGAALSPQARITQGLPVGHIARTMFFIYKLKYRNGDQILQALRQIASSLSSSGTTNEDLVSAINSIQWIEASNSLIFTGTAEALERIKELIEEIDIPLRQVFIEVLILDTTVRDSLTYNVEWGSRFGGGDTAGAQAFLQADSLIPNALDTTVGGLLPNASPLARQQGYRGGIVGRNLSKNGVFFQSIGALVTAIHTDARENIIMNPKIITEDNHTAELFVGSEQRLKTQSISNDEGSVLTNNFETVEIGTTLKITPLLGANDIITLEIEQENTNAIPEANQAQTQAEVDVNLVPIATKSKTTTRVHVPNKYFLVLSGMVSDDHQRVGNRVPCLGGIPIIGAGFRDKTLIDTKRNLMIFIRPEIVDTEDDYRRITERNQGIFDEKSKFRRSWSYEVNEALDLFNLKRTDANERCSLYKEADCQTLCPCPSY